MMRGLLVLLTWACIGVGGTNDLGMLFLRDNGKKEGVIELPSGLQYKVLKKGSGSRHPTIDTPCICHYEGRTAQKYPAGPTFDSSYARGKPAEFTPNQVIRGWTEAMRLMVEGDKWELYTPSSLGYGDSGMPPDIGGGDCLVFTMEIIKIKSKRRPGLRRVAGAAARRGGGRQSANLVPDFLPGYTVPLWW